MESAFLVHTLECMSAKVIALSLQQIGRQTLRAVAVIIRQRGGERRNRDASFDGNGNHFGVVYAGVQFTVAEMLGGVIALAMVDNVLNLFNVESYYQQFLKGVIILVAVLARRK